EAAGEPRPMQDDGRISELLRDLKDRDIRLQLDEGKLRLNAPKGAVDDILKSRIAANRDALIAHLKSANERQEKGELPSADRLPVSFAQQRLWFLDKMEPGQSHYNIFYSYKMEGKLDVEALLRVL